MAEELRQRFGLHDAVLVADRGMFSADNVSPWPRAASATSWHCAPVSRPKVSWPWTLAQLAGLPRPRDVKAEWQWREVEIIPGLRHLVVYSAFKGQP
jgi:hypothetical protein